MNFLKKFCFVFYQIFLSLNIASTKPLKLRSVVCFGSTNKLHSYCENSCVELSMSNKGIPEHSIGVFWPGKQLGIFILLVSIFVTKSFLIINTETFYKVNNCIVNIQGTHFRSICFNQHQTYFFINPLAETKIWCYEGKLANTDSNITLIIWKQY